MSESSLKLDFSNTEIAFSNKSDQELKQTFWLFKMMNNQQLVNMGSSLGMLGLKLHVPFTKYFIKKTIFKQFCGGETLRDTQKTVDQLHKYKILTILDYGVEGISEEHEMDETRDQFLAAIKFAASNASVPVVSIKVTGLASNDLLEKAQEESKLSRSDYEAFERVVNRVNDICRYGHELDVKVFIDAEQSWMQDSIDRIVNSMMEKYNREKVIVYNTFQLYRTDKLEYLYASHQKAQADGYMLGAKLVRGAYMNRERQRAEEMEYPCLIHKDKEATDKDYNQAVEYVVKNYETIASCNASHNAYSNQLQAELIAQMGIHRNHPHLNFCQLIGMSDNISYNLSSEGYNVAKYVVYGSVKQVIHYLVRRAQENTSITGDLSRELKLLQTELDRRGL